MKDMDKMSVEIADRLSGLLHERERLERKLSETGKEICQTLVAWAKESTGVREGSLFYFKGQKAELFSYYMDSPIPEEIAGAARCIGALIKTDPESFDGPRVFGHNEISVHDFEPLEVKTDEKA